MGQEQLQITSVRIQNYRSLVDAYFDVDRLNLFVGLNDVGKSNILRALDLFFNADRASGSFSFARDFSQHAKTPKRKAKEIRVDVTLRLPQSYDATEIFWRKTWRAAGLHEQGVELRHVDGSPLKPRSRVPALLDAIRFEYVPAIKGTDYFQTLLRSLHDVLLDTVEADIRSASGGFTSTINEKTRTALDVIERRLGIKSSIELPSDLRELFARLEFQSKGKLAVSLGERGDGVKVRHIPILLAYIAQQSRSIKVRGSPQAQTIWAFEEPENNLEMSKAVELATEFVEYSKDIQIFATTHSPAFYSLGMSGPDARIFLVTNAHNTNGTLVEAVVDGAFEAIDEHVGILPIIAPSFARAVAERDQMLARLEEINRLNGPTIFVEGHTDRLVIQKAIKLFAPSLLDRISIRSDTSAGANWVKDMLISWAHGRRSEKVLGILDYDDAGKDARKQISDKPRVTSANHSATQSGSGLVIKTLLLNKSQMVRQIFQKGLRLPICLEEMFPIPVWRYAEAQGWLIDRPEVVSLNNFASLNSTFESFCRERNASDDELLFLTKRVAMEHKEQFAQHVSQLSRNESTVAFAAFEDLVTEVKDFFS